MIIGHHDTAKAPLLIAEIGNNHEGSFDVACELIERAADCGVGAVKFQAFRSDYYVSRNDTARYARLKSFELTIDQFNRLGELARSLDLLYIMTPFDVEIAGELAPTVDALKIASGDNDFWPLIDEVCRADKPLIVSTGLLNLSETKSLADYLRDQRLVLKHADDVALLHCACAYPVPTEEANLLAITAMQQMLPCEIGYSDHTMGPEAVLAAVALGATIVEKHFTLSKSYSDFRDHQLAADPNEMRMIAASLPIFAQLRGCGLKQITPSEQGNLSLVRRTIVAATDLPTGHRITMEDLTWIRAKRGFVPGEEDKLIGRELLHPMSFGEPFKYGDFR